MTHPIQTRKHVYQAMFLLENQEVRKGLTAARDWLKAALEKHGIEVKVLRLWAERRLAYSIGQRRRATYFLGWLEASGEAVNAAKRDFYLVGPCFRCLFVREEEIPAEELAYGIQQLDDAGFHIPEDLPEAAAVSEEAAVEEAEPVEEETAAEAPVAEAAVEAAAERK